MAHLGIARHRTVEPAQGNRILIRPCWQRAGESGAGKAAVACVKQSLYDLKVSKIVRDLDYRQYLTAQGGMGFPSWASCRGDEGQSGKES